MPLRKAEKFFETPDGSSALWGWRNIATTDTCDPLPTYLAGFSDRTFHAVGDFTGGGTIQMQGSNDPLELTAPSTGAFNAISNRQGTTMSFTNPGVNTSQDRTLSVKPVLTGNVVGVHVYVMLHKSDISFPG